MPSLGNSIVYRNHKDYYGYASLYDGSPSHMVYFGKSSYDRKSSYDEKSSYASSYRGDPF